MHSLDPGVKRAAALVGLALIVGTFVAIGKAQRPLGPIDLHSIPAVHSTQPPAPVFPNHTQATGATVKVPPPISNSTGTLPPPQSNTANSASPQIEARTKQLPTAPINVNTAALTDLETLPGVGPALAQRIIDSRTNEGPFTSVDDLRRVKGIGPKKLEAMRLYVITQ